MSDMLNSDPYGINNDYGGGGGVVGNIGSIGTDTSGISNYITTDTVPTDRSGVTTRVTDTSGTGDTLGVVNTASNVANGTLVPAIQAVQQPKTFAELILGLQPTQPRNLQLPNTATVTTIPTNQASGGSSSPIIFIVLGIAAIAATMYYAKHKDL